MGNLRRGVLQRMKTDLPVSEAEDTAAILCVEPLASSSSSAPLLLLLLASTVDSSPSLAQKAAYPEWRAKSWQLECFLALFSSLTLILLQCNSLYVLFPVCITTSVPFLMLPFLCHSTSPPRTCTRFRPLLSIFLPSPCVPVLLLCLIYLSERRGKTVQSKRREVKSTPAAAVPGRCLDIFLVRQNRGSCSSHSTVSHSGGGSGSSSSSVAVYADCSQEGR